MVPQRVRPAITAWPTIDVPLSRVDGARRGRASLFMARRLTLYGTNLIVYDNVQLGVRSLLTKRVISQPQRGYHATRAIYADERNPRSTRRNIRQAQVADTPDPKGTMPAWLTAWADQGYSTVHPA